MKKRDSTRIATMKKLGVAFVSCRICGVDCVASHACFIAGVDLLFLLKVRKTKDMSFSAEIEKLVAWYCSEEHMKQDAETVSGVLWKAEAKLRRRMGEGPASMLVMRAFAPSLDPSQPRKLVGAHDHGLPWRWDL